MSGHTPGPWHVGSESGNDGEAEVIGSAGRTVCWTADTFDDEEGAVITDEDRANGRLIAAAPELLGALQSLLYQAQQMEGMFPDEDGTIDAAIKEAIEVINLAKGVTQ
jgi:hypothetical protein